MVKIDDKKYSTQEFTNFIQQFPTPNKKIDSNQVEELLSAFISEKLIEQEVEHFEIKLSNNSLSKLIKHFTCGYFGESKNRCFAHQMFLEFATLLLDFNLLINNVFLGLFVLKNWQLQKGVMGETSI